MKQRKAYSREERRLMIVQAIAIEVLRTAPWEEMTVAEVARKLQLTPSTKLRNMLNEMVVDGLLVSAKQKHAGIAGFRVLYALPDGSVRDMLKRAEKAIPGRNRTIRINTAQRSFLEEIS